MRRKSQHVMVRLPDELMGALREKAKKMGIGVSTLVRILIMDTFKGEIK